MDTKKIVGKDIFKRVEALQKKDKKEKLIYRIKAAALNQERQINTEGKREWIEHQIKRGKYYYVILKCEKKDYLWRIGDKEYKVRGGPRLVYKEMIFKIDGEKVIFRKLVIKKEGPVQWELGEVV